MNEQTTYALKRAAVMMALAAIPIAVGYVTENYGTETWVPFAVALLNGGYRVLEGIRDGKRAAAGDVQLSDVGSSMLPLRS